MQQELQNQNLIAAFESRSNLDRRSQSISEFRGSRVEDFKEK
jgi:hypothetical protein